MLFVHVFWDKNDLITYDGAMFIKRTISRIRMDFLLRHLFWIRTTSILSRYGTCGYQWKILKTIFSRRLQHKTRDVSRDQKGAEKDLRATSGPFQNWWCTTKRNAEDKEEKEEEEEEPYRHAFAVISLDTSCKVAAWVGDIGQFSDVAEGSSARSWPGFDYSIHDSVGGTRVTDKKRVALREGTMIISNLTSVYWV